MMSLVITGLVCLSQIASGSAGQDVHALSAPQMSGMRIWEYDLAAVHPDTVRREAAYTMHLMFKNETPREVRSYIVRLVASRAGTPVWRSDPVEVTSFYNRGAPHGGSVLPFEITEFTKATFKIPFDYWRNDLGYDPELVGATSWRNPDLHDAGHLYTKLYNLPYPAQVDLLKRDPSLLHVRESNGFDTTLIVWGCAAPAGDRIRASARGQAKFRHDRGDHLRPHGGHEPLPPGARSCA